jgi:hypothetical protein
MKSLDICIFRLEPFLAKHYANLTAKRLSRTPGIPIRDNTFLPGVALLPPVIALHSTPNISVAKFIDPSLGG